MEKFEFSMEYKEELRNIIKETEEFAEEIFKVYQQAFEELT